MQLFRLFILLALSSLLLGCGGDKYSYKNLMMHPPALQRYYNACVQEIAPESLPCETVMQAQADFTILSTRRQQDPERFGAEILQVEENMVYLKDQLDQTIASYTALGNTNAGLEAIKTKRVELDKAEAAYQLSVDKTQILLIVVAATSSV